MEAYTRKNFKDYIAMPKANMYQSIHSTVVRAKGKVLVQIRTKEMHRTAEYGIAAHWKYKESGSGEKSKTGRLQWIQNLQEWQEDLGPVHGYTQGDFFSDEVYVFSPRGDVIRAYLSVLYL